MSAANPDMSGDRRAQRAARARASNRRPRRRSLSSDPRRPAGEGPASPESAVARPRRRCYRSPGSASSRRPWSLPAAGGLQIRPPLAWSRPAPASWRSLATFPVPFRPVPAVPVDRTSCKSSWTVPRPYLFARRRRTQRSPALTASSHRTIRSGASGLLGPAASQAQPAPAPSPCNCLLSSLGSAHGVPKPLRSVRIRSSTLIRLLHGLVLLPSGISVAGTGNAMI